MQKRIIRKLNSIGFIKSIEIELINGMETITLFFSKDDANKVNDIASTKDNFFHWLISDLHVKYSDLNDVEYVGNIVDESGDYIKVVMLLDMVKPASRENIIHTIAYSKHFKIIPSLIKPGENEDKILEIFNERAADDFDEEEKNDCVEDMFLDINDNKSVGDCHAEKTIDDFPDTMKMLADLYKSLNMDIDIEVEEVIVEHDSKNHSESSYTKMTMKGLKLKGGLNNNK